MENNNNNLYSIYVRIGSSNGYCFANYDIIPASEVSQLLKPEFASKLMTLEEAEAEKARLDKLELDAWNYRDSLNR